MKTRFQVKIKARAKQSAFSGQIGEFMKIDIAAPAIEGRANLELIRFLAGIAGVPRSQVRIINGAAKPRKLVEIDGIEHAEFLRRVQ